MPDHVRSAASSGDLDGAAADLEVAWHIFEPVAEPSCAAGLMAAVAAWWSATVELRAACGDAPGAA